MMQHFVYVYHVSLLVCYLSLCFLWMEVIVLFDLHVGQLMTKVTCKFLHLFTTLVGMSLQNDDV